MESRASTIRRSSRASIISKLWLVFVTGLLLCCSHVQSKVHLSKDIKFSALLVFGDSIVDPGNNNDVNTPSKANYRPYGKDFNGGVPTGRFSDGMIPSDFIGQNFIYNIAYFSVSLSDFLILFSLNNCPINLAKIN